MKRSTNYIISIAILLMMSFLMALSSDLFSQTEKGEIYKILCNCFFVPGFLFVGCGGLVFCASKGAFDAISYLFHSLFVTHNWSKTKFKDKKTYGEYVVEKRSKTKPLPLHILVVGVGAILISIVFLIIFNNV